jgi:hypothetical protein
LEPKVKALNITDPKGGKGKDEAGWTVKGNPKGKTGKGKDDAKGKGKKGKAEHCKYFSLEEGCRFGQTCKGLAKVDKAKMVERIRR